MCQGTGGMDLTSVNKSPLREDLVNKTMEIIQEHRWDNEDGSLMEDMGQYIEGIYNSKIQPLRNMLRKWVHSTAYNPSDGCIQRLVRETTKLIKETL